MIKIKKLNIYEIVFLSFAFDSALKFELLNKRLHVGVLLILFFSILNIFKRRFFVDLIAFIKKNWTLLPFIFYTILQVIFSNRYPGAGMLLIYYFLAILVFFFFFYNSKFISNNTVIYFQWILIITGLFQYLLYKAFNYQLVFFDPEHYMVNAGFATRLRGFFLEPNWYSIIISFNTLLLIFSCKDKLFKRKFLIIFTFLCFLLNSSYTFIGIVLFVLVIRLSISFLKLKIKRSIFIIGILSFILVLLLFATRTTYKKNIDNISRLVNYGSRLIPILNTIEFMEKQNVGKKMFGFGLGSWPYIGLEQNMLGYIGFFKNREIKPAVRDSGEFQVFLLEMGYVGLFLFLFDYIIQFLSYGKKNIIYQIANAYIFACFFIYPVFKFLMYFVPYYLLRSNILKDNKIFFRR